MSVAETETAGEGPASGTVSLDVDNKSSVLNFLWIGFYSSLLLIPTLTLFRFWGRTIIRRNLWRDTSIGGEPLEYTGKGMELFVGFLIAIVTVVAPISAIVLGAQLLLGPQGVAMVIVPLYLAIFVLVGMAVFLARRYQLSRTTWRGVRFELRGSALSYGLAMLGYTLLTALTLGWFAPAMTLRLERMIWNETYYGDMPFSYDNSPEARTEPVYVSYILALVGVLIFYAIAFGGSLAMFGRAPDPTRIDPARIAGLYGIIFLGAIVLGLFSVWHQAALIRQITKSISLDQVRLRSTLGVWDLLELAITNTLLVVFTLGFGAVAAQMRVWRRVCKRLNAEGQLDLARIHQAASRGPRSGEGMVDAFDISGGAI